MIGRTISHYRIVGQLGVGGMGIVYRAEDDRLGRSVALKFLPEELATDKQAVDRLRTEARSASALNHASICAIYDVGDDEGRPYIVMELLKGQNLRDRLAAGGLKVHQIVDIGIQIADALDAAHGEGIIHRDIKPANIFLTDRNQVKLLDFGIAKLAPDFAPSGTTATPDLTHQGVTLGTISYMSPEQAAGEPLDARSDVFSLGVVLYECATGRQPFIGKTSAVILSNILNRVPVAPVALNPELPVHLQELINNCLEKDRELRYQSAADLRADLKRLRRDLESGQSHAVDVVASSETRRQTKGASASRVIPSAPIEPAQPPSTQPAQTSSHKWMAVAAVAAIALIAAAAYAYWRRTESPAPAATSTSSLTEADVQSRIDQAAAGIAAKLAEDAKQKELAAAAATAPVSRAADPPRRVAPARSEQARSEAGRSEPARAAAPSVAPSTPTTVPAPVPAPTSTPPVPPPQAAAPTEPPPAAVQRPATPQAAPPPATPLSPAPAAASSAPAPTTTRPAPSEPRREATPSAEEDEAAIRRVVSTYARAIETKDLSLFRSVKPNLSREEQRRLEEGFRAVSKQSVNVTILSIERTEQTSMVMLRRRDTIQTGARQQTAESQQTLALARAGSGWIIIEIR